MATGRWARWRELLAAAQRSIKFGHTKKAAAAGREAGRATAVVRSRRSVPGNEGAWPIIPEGNPRKSDCAAISLPGVGLRWQRSVWAPANKANTGNQAGGPWWQQSDIAVRDFKPGPPSQTLILCGSYDGIAALSMAGAHDGGVGQDGARMVLVVPG